MLTQDCDPGQPRFSRRWLFLLAPLLFFYSVSTFAVTGEIDLTTSFIGFFAVAIFVLAYALVMAEEKIHMRKSKPVLIAAGIIWSLIGWVYVQNGMSETSEYAFRMTLLEFTELMLFL
ncbi:MAG: sodium:proton antiporter NhaD, partial [Halomonas sp.]